MLVGVDVGAGVAVAVGDGLGVGAGVRVGVGGGVGVEVGMGEEVGVGVGRAVGVGVAAAQAARSSMRPDAQHDVTTESLIWLLPRESTPPPPRLLPSGLWGLPASTASARCLR